MSSAARFQAENVTGTHARARARKYPTACTLLKKRNATHRGRMSATRSIVTSCNVNRRSLRWRSHAPSDIDVPSVTLHDTVASTSVRSINASMPDCRISTLPRARARISPRMPENAGETGDRRLINRARFTHRHIAIIRASAGALRSRRDYLRMRA